jgi:hypothetical protein
MASIALAISIGGSVFAERQKCVADARDLIDRFDALDEELFFRDPYVSSKIRSAKTIEELTQTKLTYPIRHSSLKDSSSDEMVAEETKVIRRADPDEYGHLRVQITILRPATRAQDIFDALPYGKKTLVEAVAELDKQPSHSSVIRLEPDCGLGSVASRLITG